MRYLKNVTTLMYNPDKCTGCGLCLEVCPQGVFVWNGKPAKIRAIRITDRDACMECGACMVNCAWSAIQVRPGVGCAAAIVYSKLTGKKEITCGGDSGCCSS